MAESSDRERVRAIIGAGLSDDEADILVATSGALSRAVAAMPHEQLRKLEPALRSQPGPRLSEPGPRRA